MKSKLSSSLIIFLFLSPFITLLMSIGIATQFNWSELIWALKNTLIQSLCSSFLIVLFGLWGALGLFFLENKLPLRIYHFMEGLILLPNILPSLFIILSSLYVINPFPFGKVGIIIIHLLMNVGIASLSLKNLIESKVGAMAELATIEGASPFSFLWTGIFTYLKKEFLIIALFFFSICFISFQIPLVVGGNNGTTLEILIYEKIRIDNNLAQALSLALIQCLALFLLAFVSSIFSHSNKGIHNPLLAKKEFLSPQLLQYKTGLIPLLVSTLLLFISPLIAIPNGIRQLQNMQFPWGTFPDLILTSFAIAMTTGFVVIALSLLISFFHDQKFLHGFLYSFVAPSPVILGLCFYIWNWVQFIPINICLGLGLCFLWFTGLYRLFISHQIHALKNQIWVAQSLGASPFLIFISIIIPQVSLSIGKAAGISALWSIGDFALSQFLSGEDFHLAMAIKTLGDHYRLSSALTLSWILIVIGGISYILFLGVGRVFSKKSFL